MHWLWAAAAGLDGDPVQIQAVLAVAETAQSATKGRVVRSDCGVLIARLETQLRKPGAADDANGTVWRSQDESAELSVASVTPGAARRNAYYLDVRLSLAEGTRGFSDDGRGRVTAKEGFYRVAIRRSGSRGWVFRFAGYKWAASSILETLNRPAAEAAA